MKDRERAEALLNFVKDELLKQLHNMNYPTGYSTKAVPHATILELPKLLGKEVESKLLEFRNEGLREELIKFKSKFNQWPHTMITDLMIV